MWISVAVSLSFLLIFKYADFLIENVNQLPGVSLPLSKLSLPIGISFYTFQIISYTVDVWRGDTKAQRNIISFGTYVSLFPQLIAGPIVRYTDIERELQERKHSVTLAASGIQRFLIGLSKKVLIANVLGELTDICLKTSQPSILSWWMYAAALVLQIYFDFSGYSDMAIGLGRIFGFQFPENFNYPLISRSVKEFWRRWHISLSSWFRCLQDCGMAHHGILSCGELVLECFFCASDFYGENGWNECRLLFHICICFLLFYLASFFFQQTQYHRLCSE